LRALSGRRGVGSTAALRGFDSGANDDASKWLFDAGVTLLKMSSPQPGRS
jgi:hypothetical protein